MKRDGTPRAREGSGYRSEEGGSSVLWGGSVYGMICCGLGVPNGKQRDPSTL
jgi:hypothetical protein